MKNFSRNSEKIQITTASGKLIGHVQGNKFIKKVSASRHFLRTPPAIGFDVASLDEAEKAGAEWVQVEDRETGTIYRASIAHIREKGVTLDRGFGLQLALPMAGWIRTRRGGQLAEQLPLGV